MNMLIIVIVMVVLVLGAQGDEWAEEGLKERDRRQATGDISDLLNQLLQNYRGKIDCTFPTCQNPFTPTQCNTFCADTRFFKPQINLFQSCLQTANAADCGVDLENLVVGDVSIPLEVSSYNGTCTLTGYLVIKVGDLLSSSIGTASTENPNNLIVASSVQWTNLTLQCTPNGQTNVRKRHLLPETPSKYLPGLQCPGKGPKPTTTKPTTTTPTTATSTTAKPTVDPNAIPPGPITFQQTLYYNYDNGDFSATVYNITLDPSVPLQYQENIMTAVTNALQTEDIATPLVKIIYEFFNQMINYALKPGNCKCS